MLKIPISFILQLRHNISVNNIRNGLLASTGLSWFKTIKVSFLFIVGLLLVNCGGASITVDTFTLCPNVTIPNIGQQVYRFQGSGKDFRSLKYYANLGYEEGSCASNDNLMAVALPIKLRLVAGPAFNAKESLIVTSVLIDQKGKKIATAKKPLSLLDAVSDGKTIAAGQEIFFRWVDNVSFRIDHPPESYKIVYSIQLTGREIANMKALGVKTITNLPAGVFLSNE